MVDGYIIAIATLAFFMSFAIGANDAANALATSYGSKALGLLYLVLLGSIFEFIGAYFCSGHVAGKLVGNIIGGVDQIDQTTTEQMMLSTSIASFIFIMSSSVFGMPISGTHTVVGALIGSGLATVGASSIEWGKLGTIVASWFVAPILSIILCSIFFIAVCSLTLDSKRFSFASRALWLTLMTAFAFTLITVMLIKLVQESNTSFTPAQWGALAASPILGVFITRALLAALVKGQRTPCSTVLAATLKFWTGTDFCEMLKGKVITTQTVELNNMSPNGMADEAARQRAESIRLKAESEVINEIYRYLMLVAAMMVCLGHGSNDVANSISPLLVTLEVEGDNIQMAYLLGSVGIALGLLCLGYKVMETLGTKVVKLDFCKGFTAQFATAFSVNVGSIIGLPLSTTHCMVGALMGLIIAERFTAVKNVYGDGAVQPDAEKPVASINSPARDISAPHENVQSQGEAQSTANSVKESGKTEKDAVQGSVIVRIIAWWVATVPVALVTSFVITKIMV